jgi:hypothetical protein
LAFEYAKKVDSQEDQDHLFADIALLTVQLDPVKAVERLKVITSAEYRLEATARVYKAWYVRDPEAAWKHEEQLDIADAEKAWALAGITMGLKDLKKAETIASTIKDRKAREQAYYSIGDRVVEAEPDRASEFRDKTDATSYELILSEALRSAIQKKDLRTADILCNSPQLEDTKFSNLEILAGAYRLSGDLAGALAIADRSPKGFRDSILVQAIPSLAKRDPAEAWRAAEKVAPDLLLKGRAYYEFGRAMEADRKDLGKWTSQVADPAHKAWLLAGSIAARAERGDIALPLPVELLDTSAGDSALIAVAEECQRRKLSWSAVDAARQIGSEGCRDNTLIYLVAEMSESEPFKALAVSQLVTSPWVRSNILGRAGWYLTAHDEATKPWLSREFRKLAGDLEQKELKDRRRYPASWYGELSDLVANWTFIDPHAAADYLKTEEPEELSEGSHSGEAVRARAALYESFGQAYARLDFEAALAWGLEIEKPPLMKARFLYGAAEGALGRGCTPRQVPVMPPSSFLP